MHGTSVAKLTPYYDKACRALAKAHSVDEVAEINNEAIGMKAYARQAKNKQLEMEATEIRFRASRRIGQLIALQKATVGLAKGTRGTIRGKDKSGGVQLAPLDATLPTLKQAGIDKSLAKFARKLAKLTDAEFEAILAERREIIIAATAKIAVDLFGDAAARILKERKRQARRDSNRQKIARITCDEIPADVKFASIVIDPPWDWGDEGDVDQLGRARPTYATMTIEQLADFTMVRDHADVDCHLYMWITNRSLPKGFTLLEHWGFRYVTTLTWFKPSFGMGNYFRGQTEQLLFGVKGSQPLKRNDIGTGFHWPRGPLGHSSKPAEMYEMVESASPGPYLEIFSRHERPDWTSWGENSRAAAA
jgi:N6-adenosine-specific RNA methylase IME4